MFSGRMVQNVYLAIPTLLFVMYYLSYLFEQVAPY